MSAAHFLRAGDRDYRAGRPCNAKQFCKFPAHAGKYYTLGWQRAFQGKMTAMSRGNVAEAGW